MNETNEYVRVGYLSFRGSRCNKYMKLDDVIPINESSTGINSKIVRFGQYSSYVYFCSNLCGTVCHFWIDIIDGI